MRKLYKHTGFVLILCFILSVFLFATSCGEDNSVYTFDYNGETAYVKGEEFKNGTLAVYKDGDLYKTTTIDKTVIDNFSTENTVKSEFMIKFENKTFSVPYYVCVKINVKSQPDRTTADGIRVYENIYYGDRAETPLEIDDTQKFDLYLPAEVNEDTPVLLFLHGGSWLHGTKNNRSEAEFCEKTTKECGYACFSMNYILQSATNPRTAATMEAMTSDIAIMTAYLKHFLPEIGINATKIAVGGYSAGGHLSSLYAYKYGSSSPVEIGFNLSLAGPVQLSDGAYREVIEHILHKEPLTEIPENYLFALNSLIPPVVSAFLGTKVSDFNFRSDDLSELFNEIGKYSPIEFVSDISCPTILAYGDTPKEYENLPFKIFPDKYINDTIIPTENFYNLRQKLNDNAIINSSRLFNGLTHEYVISDAQCIEWVLSQLNIFKNYL